MNLLVLKNTFNVWAYKLPYDKHSKSRVSSLWNETHVIPSNGTEPTSAHPGVLGALTLYHRSTAISFSTHSSGELSFSTPLEYFSLWYSCIIRQYLQKKHTEDLCWQSTQLWMPVLAFWSDESQTPFYKKVYAQWKDVYLHCHSQTAAIQNPKAFGQPALTYPVGDKIKKQTSGTILSLSELLAMHVLKTQCFGFRDRVTCDPRLA